MSFSPEKDSFAPPRTKKSGLWTESNSTIRSGKSFSRKDSSSFDNDKFRSMSPLGRDDSEDDIPLIPEIDEIQDDDFGDISEAPEVPSNLATFTQLNTELKKMAAFTVIDDLNLGFLSKHLYQECDLKEGDNRWSWDLLFTEVSSDLRSEWEHQKKPNQ